MAEIRKISLFDDANLQTYSRLDGNSDDAVGSYDGTDSNVTYNKANGKYGKGAGFASGYIELNSALKRANNSTNSLSFWFKTTATAQSMMYGEGSTTSALPLYNIDINIGASGRVRFSMRNLASSNAEISGSGSGFNDDDWHLVVVTKNGSNFEMWVDDVSQGTLSSAIVPETNRPGFGALLRSGEGIYLDGEIDDYAFWDDVLTSGERAALFAVGRRVMLID